MKNLLFIAYLYPPIFNSGTRRSLEFVNHLPDHGWRPLVLTLADPAPQDCDPSLLDEVRHGTRIERAPLWSTHFARRVGARLAPLFDGARIAAGLAWRLRARWNVPDDCASWAPMAVQRALQLHAEQPFDAIYATGWPWSSFLIARQISRRTGVPFVVDYRDLWQPAEVAWDQATWLQRHLNPWLERRVLRSAAAVIATTASFLDLLPQAALPARRYAITNGFDPRDFPPAAPAPADGKVRVVYTGVWRPGYGPDDLYAALQLLRARQAPGLERLQLVMAGFAPGRAHAAGIGDLVQEHGRVTHAQALEMMRSADALYLPVSGGVYEYASMPGKLFDYMGSGRPILASAHPGSEVARAIEQVGGGCRVAPGDSAALADVLQALCAGEAGIFAARRPEELAKYTRAGLTRQLAAVLDAVAP